MVLISKFKSVPYFNLLNAPEEAFGSSLVIIIICNGRGVRLIDDMKYSRNSVDEY